MIYSTVADIFAANEETRRRLVSRVEALDEAGHARRTSAEAWSVAELVEHLALTERQLLQLVRMLLGKTESASSSSAPGDGEGEAAAAVACFPFSLDEFAERARGQKLNAPDGIRPRGQSVAESLASLRESRAALEELRPRLERAGPSRATYPHPAFGPLNLYQWLAFIGLHEERHLAQINQRLAAAAE